MNGRTTQRYGMRMPDSWIPTVEITVAEVAPLAQPLRGYGSITAGYKYVVVAKRRGFTQAHAIKRALDWSRAHGDPR